MELNADFHSLNKDIREADLSSLNEIANIKDIVAHIPKIDKGIVSVGFVIFAKQIEKTIEETVIIMLAFVSAINVSLN